jgi:DNA polymerase III epsilon subunit-like protein
MRVFLDFEASSLSKKSYPIEVGWVFEDGTQEAHLIRPAPEWTDWDAEAALMHGLTREQLRAQGEPVGDVAARMVDVLLGHQVYASAPSWDGKWLSVLLRAAGHPRHELRLMDSDIVLAEAVRARLGGAASQERVTALIEAVRKGAGANEPEHRALADARREWRIWRHLAHGS